jgi:SAM-dependent methyltransferase
MDWDLGRYEHIAEQLLPVAEASVDRLDPATGEHIADVGSGTGNAALLVASRGAVTTAIDPSPRLLRVAQERARAEGLEIEALLGLADAIPAPDASFDAFISVFGVIFAPDAQAAAAEMSRTLGPDGRLVLSAWIPGGAIGDQAKVRRDAVAMALGEELGPPPFAWHDTKALESLLGPLGFTVVTEESTLSFKARSASEYVDQEFRLHPMWVEARSILEPIGTWSQTAELAARILEEANEDQNAFCVTSRFVIVSAFRGREVRRLAQ